MSPFSILLLLVLGVILYSLWPLIRQVVRISSVHRQVKREYRRQEEAAQEQAAREERAQKSSADILREAQHDLGGGRYVEYEEVDDDSSGNS